MRLFVALDIDDPIRRRIADFMQINRAHSPDARWVRPESLHITLKFIGEQPESALEKITQMLNTTSADAIDLNFRGFGFFPTPRSPRVFWIGVESGSNLAALAKTIDAKLGTFGAAKEDHPYNPHLTLARAAGGSGSPRRQKTDRLNSRFQLLQEKLSSQPAPEFGTMTAREFFLYQSRLSPGGSQYSKLAGFALR
ncbi:MAG TPA: RNA 2',3'-cyclic phosphodiesterase [Candidatus Binatia bacterium]|nr:RNA 2',3'-cyclic phosphodiesterase [Candidatus Binatia bacterium]